MQRWSHTSTVLLLFWLALQTICSAQVQDRLDQLREQTESKDHDTRWQAAKGLGDLLPAGGENQSEVLELLVKLAADRYSTFVADEASLAISGLQGQPVSKERLTANLDALLRSDLVTHRRAALLAYPLRAHEALQRAVGKGLQDEEPSVRLAAVDKLNRLVDGDVLKWLPGARKHIGSAPPFGRLMAKQIAPLLEDKTPDVQKPAATLHNALLVRAHLEELTLRRGTGDVAPAEDGPRIDQGELKFAAVHIKGDRGARGNRLSAAASDGTVLAVGYDYDSVFDGDGTKRGYLHFYDLQTGRRIGAVPGNFGPVRSLSFGKDGAVYVTLGKYEEFGGP